jgi:hypothetical protein
VATWTREQVAARALELVGVTSPAVAEDQLLAESAVDLVLLDLGSQVTFDSAAIPDWAYIPVAKMVALEISGFFHVGIDRRQILEMDAAAAKRLVDRATAFVRHPAPIVARDY